MRSTVSPAAVTMMMLTLGVLIAQPARQRNPSSSGSPMSSRASEGVSRFTRRRNSAPGGNAPSLR